MGNRFKRGLAIALSVMCMVAFSFTGVFAAGSPTSGKDYKGINPDGYKAGTYDTTYKTKTATLVGVKKSVKAKTIATITVKGKKYKVKKVKAKAFAKAKKLKKINIKCTYYVQFDKKAFKGLKKSQVKKIKVYINKKMSKKNYKKLKKALIKAGIKKGNIKKKKF